MACMDKFPIGFWNYAPTGQYGPEAVQDWADLGMTFAISPEYYDGCDKSAMLKILDACAERDIKVIVSDSRARWWSGKTEEECEAVFRQAYEDMLPSDARRVVDDYLATQSMPKCRRIAAIRRQGCLMQNPVTRLGQILFG